MSTPDKTDTPAPATDFETQVNSLIPNLDNPDWDSSEVEPALLYAANAEKRRRDTQSEFTKSQQSLKATELRATKLEEKLSSTIMESLPLREQSKLEELKNTDPDAWRAELDKLEDNAKGQLATELETINKESSQLSEKERRSQVFDQFQTDNPGITGEMLDNDLPPRITNKLANGEATFEDFLAEAKKYLTANKVIADSEQAPGFDDLAKASGGSKPGETDTDRAAAANYDNEVY